MLRHLILVLTLLLLPAASQAATCSNPTGETGAIVFNTTYSVVQVCNTTGNWVALGGNGNDGSSETDPQVGGLTNGKWCTSDGTMVTCNTDAPTFTAGLTDLTDTGISAPSDGQVLTYSGGTWVNATPTASDATKLISSTFEVIANSTGYVSLSTASSTWGYLGSTASYLPYLNSLGVSATNISVSTINGVAASSLGGVSPTNVPAFSVHRNGSSQTVTTSTWTKILFTTEDFDTYNNFDTSTSRFMPTVAGKYLFDATVFCQSSTACNLSIRKNGTDYLYNLTRESSGMPHISGVVDMNGTTDYVEVWAYNTGGTSIEGTSYSTRFSGSLLASGNGLISGTGATALSGLSDVSLASPATGQVLTYNGSSWVNTTPSATTVISGTTTMEDNFPDAIKCTGGNGWFYLYNSSSNSSGAQVQYDTVHVSVSAQLFFTKSNGAYANNSNLTGFDCINKSISTLYTEGKAFNFIGNSGAGGGALGDRITSGTLAVTANSGTAIVSLSTNGTTWGYLGSTASYLPSLTTNALNVGGLTLTSSSLVSSSATVAFSAYRSGSQTISANTYVKALFTSETFDTNNNFDTTTSRFTATVPGKYQFNLSVVCSGSSACYAVFYKNGALYLQNSGGTTYAQTSEVISLAAGDYVEGYVYNTGGTTMLGDMTYTRFSGALINGGSSGGGTSALSGLTDVTLSGLTSGQTLTYNGSAWVNGTPTAADATKLISSTFEVIANATGYVSLSTASTTWGYLGSEASYLPKVTSAHVSATNVSATVAQFADKTSAGTCDATTYYTLQFVNGRPYYCRP